MRYPSEHKETVRQRIIEAASRVLRRDGIWGVSIPALMKKAGMSHGGFYVHFKDRDELVAEAVTFAANETGAQVFARAPDLRTVLRTYVSREHVERPDAGCVLAALGADAPRERVRIRRAFGRAVHGFLSLLDVKRGGPASNVSPSDETIALACRMVGAVVLARIADDDVLADRILAVAREIPTHKES